MKSLSGIDMMEVTRLTREGQLDRAMDLLRVMHRIRQETPNGLSKSVKFVVDPIGEPIDIVDMEPPCEANGGAWTAANPQAPTSSPRPEPSGVGGPLRSLFDLSLKPRLRASTSTSKPAMRESPGALRVKRTFTDKGQQLSCSVYVPSSYDGTPRPLVVMLHGCTQSPDDFATGTQMNVLAEEEGFLVAYPEQISAVNPLKCWSWFNPRDQSREGGEPALIAGVTRAIMDEFAIDAQRVYIAGLSAGGAMAAILGETYPDIYAAVGVHSGLAPGSAVDISSALALMKNGVCRQNASTSSICAPTIIFHGDADTTVHPSNGDSVAARVRGSRRGMVQSSVGTSAGGIPFVRTVESDIDGHPFLEQWVVQGAGHAWSGGQENGSFVEPNGPDASRAMWQFFSQHSKPRTL